MKLAYQVATPDLKRSPLVTAYQGEFENAFKLLHDNGYHGIELMVRDPKALSTKYLSSLLDKYGIEFAMIATGEIWAQEHISLSDPDPIKRTRCIDCFKEFIDLASPFHAQVNIGRVRGELKEDFPHEETWRLAIDAFKEVSDYAAPRGVTIILEPVNWLQCNFINSTEDGRKVVDLVGRENFKIMLDLFHMNIQDKDIIEEISLSKGYFSYVHVCDRNRLYPGNSSFDFESIMSALKAIGYDSWISVEILQVPDGETCIKKSAEKLIPLL